jgi:hypothetical protein
MTVETVLNGVIRAQEYVPSEDGKQFLGAIVDCTDGTQWVVDYEEQSPFHLFANRRVVASGKPYIPNRRVQHLSAAGNRSIGHIDVLGMCLAEPVRDLPFAEMGPRQRLHGQFTRRATSGGRRTGTRSWCSQPRNTANWSDEIVRKMPAAGVSIERIDVKKIVEEVNHHPAEVKKAFQVLSDTFGAGAK